VPEATKQLINAVNSSFEEDSPESENVPFVPKAYFRNIQYKFILPSDLRFPGI
jgi:hypothetical protein